MQIIIDETSRLSSLVTELLDFSKLQAGTLKMEPSVFSLTQAVTAILTRYNKLKEQEGYQILFEPAEECNVYADEGRIGQAVSYTHLLGTSAPSMASTTSSATALDRATSRPLRPRPCAKSSPMAACIPLTASSAPRPLPTRCV